MKKIILTGLLCGMVLTSLSALETSGKVKIKKSPIDTNFLSTENGGSLSAIDAYSDGIGMKVVGVDNSQLDNTKMNSNVFSYGLLAKNEVVSLKEFLNNKNVGSGTDIEIIGGDAGVNTNIGDPCNDGNSSTTNDVYIDTNGTCQGIVVRTENKCFGDEIGSSFIYNSKTYLVVDDVSIRENLGRAETLCTSNVVFMDSLFENNTSFNQDISSWDTSHVFSMNNMFNHSTSFNQNINSWDVSSVNDMSTMFFYAISFNQPLNNWNTSNVMSMSLMFQNATSFNQNINSWNVSNVENMHMMFTHALSFNQPLNNWNTSSVSDMDYMFAFATSFNQNISGWNTSSIPDKGVFVYDFFMNSGLDPLNVPLI